MEHEELIFNFYEFLMLSTNYRTIILLFAIHIFIQEQPILTWVNSSIQMPISRASLTASISSSCTSWPVTTTTPFKEFASTLSVPKPPSSATTSPALSATKKPTRAVSRSNFRVLPQLFLPGLSDRKNFFSVCDLENYFFNELEKARAPLVERHKFGDLELKYVQIIR